MRTVVTGIEFFGWNHGVCIVCDNCGKTASPGYYRGNQKYEMLKEAEKLGWTEELCPSCNKDS